MPSKVSDRRRRLRSNANHPPPPWMDDSEDEPLDEVAALLRVTVASLEARDAVRYQRGSDALAFNCQGATVTISPISAIEETLRMTLVFAAAGAYSGKRHDVGAFGLDPVIRANKLQARALQKRLEPILEKKIRLAVIEAVWDVTRELLDEIDLPKDAPGVHTRRALRDSAAVVRSAAAAKDRAGAPRGKRPLMTGAGREVVEIDVVADYERRINERSSKLNRQGLPVRRVRLDVRREMAEEYGWTEDQLRKVLERGRKSRKE